MKKIVLLLFVALQTSAFPQIPFQNGFPVSFEDEQTLNPIIIDQLLPGSTEKQLITIIGNGIAGSNSPLRLVCYSHNGTIIWERVLFPVGFQQPTVIKPAIGDIDNDGDKEIVVPYVYAHEHGAFVYCLNVFNHDGTDYGNGWPLTGFTNLSNVSLGNIDNDADLEILVVQNTNQVAVYHHDTEMANGWPYVLSDSWTMIWATPTIADLDFDNQNEVIVVLSKFSTPESYIAVFDNQGNILTGWPKLLNKRVLWTSQSIADFNPQNNSLEFVFADDDFNSTIHIFDMYGNYAPGWPVTINNGDSYYSTNIFTAYGFNESISEFEYTLDNKGNGSSPLVIGDLQSDGTLQVIITGMNQIHILNQDGSEYIPFPGLKISNGQIYSPSICDIDNNGSIDLIFVQLEIDQSSSQVWQKLYAYDNSGVLLPNFPIIIKEFDLSISSILSYRYFTPTVDDIDNDGDIEIAITGFRYFGNTSFDNGLLAVFDLNSYYNFEKIQFSDVLKNNWNNGIYCNYIENNLFGYNIYYDNIRLTNDAVVLNGNVVKILSETKITANASDHKLEVQGEVFINDGCYFTSIGNETWEGLQINNQAFEMSINSVVFNNCNLSGSSKSLLVQNSQFNNSAIRYSYGNLFIENSLFENSPISAKKGGSKSSIVEINSECIIKNYTGEVAVNIEGYANFDIDDCTIEFNNKDGISIFNSGHSLGTRNLGNNTLINNGYNNNGAGIKLYNSYANVFGDQLIEGNNYGILSLNNSHLSISGNIEANYSYETQLIRDNRKHQIYATQNSFPFFIKWNGIIDENNTSPLIYYSSPNLEELLVVSDNYWGNNFDPINDLYPYSSYNYQPIWELNNGTIGAEGAEVMYNSAQEKITQEDYTGAKINFQQIINDYPASIYSQAALRELFSLEEHASNDYAALKTYYSTNYKILNNPELEKLAEYLANSCEIKLENYPTAISWFENIILNPETIEDSIFAIIDLGYTYFIIENAGLKHANAGNLIEHMPESMYQFEEKRDYLLTLLFKDFEQEEVFEKEPNQLKLGELLLNAPNPFKNFTKIYYKIKESAMVEIEVYDYTGKIIRVIPQGYKGKGTYSIDFNTNGISKGIYFYSIKINGIRSDSKKMSII
jgi:hypothetical protein